LTPHKETFETWNKLASLYEEKFMHLDIYNESYDRFCEMISVRNAAILEIGCGPGNIARYILSKRPDFRLEGIDIAPAMIELAQKNNPSARFFVMDSRDINSIDKKFDAIICGFCIPYLSTDETSKLINDCKNLLNEKGVLYISLVEGEYSKSGFMTGSTGDRTYFYFHELNTILENLQASQFRSPEIMKVNYRKADGSVEIHTIVIAGS
jgi:ubiquinone/menaquinone biosynthesis C-methylase UbiE